jgi:outer membrane lipoprotein carrier protein
MKLCRILVLVFILGCVASAQDVRKIAQAVDRRYNSLQSLQSEFVESYRGAGVTRNEAGTLWLKRPGKMRWEYRQPREKVFLSDGKTAWFYVPGERQARKADVKKLDDFRSPLRYLLGKTKLQKEFNNLSPAPDKQPLNAGNIVLRGVPKGMEDRVSQVLLEISPDYWIERVVIEEIDGSSTEFSFSNHKINVPVTDQRFKFLPPPGVETIEATHLGQ